MALTYAEADLFARFGEDMRWAEWPPGCFIRRVTLPAPAIEGYTAMIFTPTAMEQNGNLWERA